MKLTLSDCVQRINQILNYPSVAYEDISHFFDHAIAELNTILKTAIPSVSEMVFNNTIDVTIQDSTVLLESVPNNSASIYTFSEIPTASPSSGGNTYGYYSSENMIDRAFYVWDGTLWRRFDNLYGVCFADAKKTSYAAVPVGRQAFWVETPAMRTLEVDVCTYMPSDWWVLFVIPYVCFKFAVRNGDSGELYQTEFTEGLQQLQTCYDVPNFVTLSTVAGIPAYTEIVKNNLDKLTLKIPTRAITDDMRVGNAISAVFGNIFDKGGWGI